MPVSISVVIPVFNRSATIAEAISSVRAQTRVPLELLVVDDASTDDSVRIAEGAGAKVIRLTTNRGSAGARNEGTRQATGDVIAWLDSDDYWEPPHLATVAGLLDHFPRAGAASAPIRLVGARTGVWKPHIPTGSPGDVVREAFTDWLAPPSTTIVRRQALIDVGGFDESERYSEDFDLWLRLARTNLFIASSEITANWRWHDQQMSSSPERQWRALYVFRKRALDAIEADGELELSRDLARIFRERWESDLQTAWDDGRVEWLRELVAFGAIVPDAPRALQRKWALRARLPAALRPALRAARALMRRSSPAASDDLAPHSRA